MINMKKSAVAAALLGLGLAGMGSAQAATCATVGACFSFIGGSAPVASGSQPPTSGSYFTMLASDTNDDLVPDANVYTSMRAAGGTGIPGPVGSLNFTQANPANTIDRPWAFFGPTGQHLSDQPMEVTGTGNTLSVNMSGWNVFWNNVTINMGLGSPAVLANNDGIWGNGNDTLIYSALVPNDGTTNFGNVPYGLHLVGSYTPAAVPIPAAVWLLGSGLIGLVGVARRRKALAA